jgi:hypothetical protein
MTLWLGRRSSRTPAECAWAYTSYAYSDSAHPRAAAALSSGEQ